MRKLNSGLADRVDPMKFEHPMRVGFSDAEKFLELEVEDLEDNRTIGDSSVQELMLEDEMDKKERQWNMIVDIINTTRSLLDERRRLFEEMYFNYVLKMHKEDDFFRFFDNNWR